MKADAPRTGTNILHDLIVSPLPYNKTYAQLSPDDKRMLRGLYEHMGPDDEPPFPLRGYKTIFKALSEIQGKMLVVGELDIAVMVDANGEGSSVTIYKAPDPEIARVVATLMMLEKYKPALCSGKPCEQAFPLRAHFSVTPRP
ncbi:hypothetical protein ASD15_17180 [Massilia sp. Root351]|uniref:hypothetical protein n=1 Tax=Massilia sp. Root351 TaxID=1736522 RepID=UPI0007099766|nr:hypothetical protein [Massilia sp. Root351]KQV79767.1 hypothetical protein ASD15_17180 [Massilia sp. Root351]